MIINTIDMPDFKISEFPENPAKYAAKQLLINLQEYRNQINTPFVPSTAYGALARNTGSYRTYHRIIVDGNSKVIQRSIAIDGFPIGDIFKAWLMALNSKLWGGIGIYFDTKLNGKPLPMLHLDLRKNSLIWFRINYNYYYPNNKDFYEKLLNLLFIHRNDFKK